MEIEQIIAGFTEEDNTAVYQEVEQLDKQIKIHHFERLFKENLPHFEPEIFSLGTDSIEFQELANKAIWDGLTELVKRQRAVEIYKHRYDEVA